MCRPLVGVFVRGMRARCAPVRRTGWLSVLLGCGRRPQWARAVCLRRRGKWETHCSAALSPREPGLPSPFAGKGERDVWDPRVECVPVRGGASDTAPVGALLESAAERQDGRRLAVLGLDRRPPGERGVNGPGVPVGLPGAGRARNAVDLPHRPRPEDRCRRARRGRS